MSGKARGIALAAVIAIAIAVGYACHEKDSAPAPQTTTNPEPTGSTTTGATTEMGRSGGGPIGPASAVTDAGAVAASGDGVIEGTVLLDGTPPPMSELKRGADPVCMKGPAMDQQVVVDVGKLANVIVSVSSLPADATPPSQLLVVDQSGCSFQPRVQAGVTGQRLEIRNGDPTLHNTHAYESGKTVFNKAQPPKGEPIAQQLPPAGTVMKLKCDVHPWMTAFVVSEPNRHFAKSANDGSFRIDGLPAGHHTLTAWHELFGKKTVEVDVPAHGSARVAIHFGADDRG